MVKECLKDKVYYEGEFADPNDWNICNVADIKRLPGGVTFSGGEALLQMEKLVPVINDLHKEGVHVAVETTLFVSKEALEQAIKYMDFFLCRCEDSG